MVQLTIISVLVGLAESGVLVFGIIPSPLFDLARDVGTSFSHLL